MKFLRHGKILICLKIPESEFYELKAGVLRSIYRP